MGDSARGSMHDVKAYGTVCDLDAIPDVVALATPHQVRLLSLDLADVGSMV